MLTSKLLLTKNIAESYLASKQAPAIQMSYYFENSPSKPLVESEYIQIDDLDKDIFQTVTLLQGL